VTAYTDATKIAAYLGVTLSAPQITQAGLAAQAASDWIDEYKGRSWQIASPITDELHTLVGDRVYLTNRPVVAVTSVKTRAAAFVGFGWTTLGASQYELLDAANGVLLIQGWSASSEALVQVTYTHSATSAPSTIALAATIIAASWLAPTLAPSTAGLESVAVGQNDVNVKFRKDRGDVPQEALTLLGARPVVIA
jgi:hypothetical protein